MSDIVQYDLFGNPIEDKPKKDWTGDTHSVFVTVGASNHSKGERQNEDFYASHPEAGEWLMRLEKFDGPIWEPCAGQGHLSKVFEAHGYEVKSTDLIDRGYGQGGINFLDPSITEWNGAIVTNPPFAFAQEIIEKSLSIIPEGQKVAMFLRTLFLEGQARRKLFDALSARRMETSTTTQAVRKVTLGLSGLKVTRETLFLSGSTRRRKKDGKRHTWSRWKKLDWL